jgi:hypothetical protein
VLVSPATPDSDASTPAGAFHTPRLPSVRAYTPAMAPQAAKSPMAPPRSGSAERIRGM